MFMISLFFIYFSINNNFIPRRAFLLMQLSARRVSSDEDDGAPGSSELVGWLVIKLVGREKVYTRLSGDTYHKTLLQLKAVPWL